MQNPFKGSFNLDFHTNQVRVKWLILIVAVIIGGGSILYTNHLVSQLKRREKEKIRLYAKAVEFAGTPEATSAALTFITSYIITPKNTLPVILVDSASSNILNTNNLNIKSRYPAGIEKEKQQLLQKMKQENVPERIILRNGPDGSISDIQYVYYRNSYLLRQLSTYPYIQLSVITIFGFIAYLAFSYSRRSEQNSVWVGMARETAHQLGTPLSSLIAWVEYIKSMAEMESRHDVVKELEKDIQHLEMITARFSNIGSIPVLKVEKVREAVNDCISYLKPRVSSKVNFKIETNAPDIVARLNKPLFEWVVENIIKNGIDAMSGIGNITVTIGRDTEKEVFVDITDNGKGIAKGKSKEVFKPGFTTKERGWGLGLALVRRIIEHYHNGRIYVKSSQADVGTVFRIILKA